MFVVLVIGAVLLVTVSAGVLLSRPKHETIRDHQRALAALHEAELPRSPTATEARPVVTLTDHVHILDGPPAGRPGPRRRTRPAPRRQPAARRRIADIAERPTIAKLPTAAFVEIPPRAVFPAEPVPIALEPVALVFDDDGPAVLRGAESSALPSIPPTIVSIANRRRRRRPAMRGAVTVGVLVVLAVGTSIVVGAGHRSPKPVAAKVPPSDVTRPHHPTTPSPTSAPKSVAPVAPVAPAVETAAGNGTVIVTVPFTLTLAPTGLCWVDVTTTTGQTVFQGTLSAGQRQQVAGAGPLVIRLGNTSAMTLMLNGAQLDLSRVARTANVQFVT